MSTSLRSAERKERASDLSDRDTQLTKPLSVKRPTVICPELVSDLWVEVGIPKFAGEPEKAVTPFVEANSVSYGPVSRPRATREAWSGGARGGAPEDAFPNSRRVCSGLSCKHNGKHER